jgi:AraC-like DNA-binding protein
MKLFNKKIQMEDQLFYKEEHVNCFLYDNYNDPIIMRVDKMKGETLHVNGVNNRIFFLLKGKINFLYASKQNTCEEGNFILLPRGCEYIMKMEKDTSIVVVDVHYNVNFCEHFPLEILHKLSKGLKSKSSGVIYPLRINQLVSIYLTNITATISAGLKCKYFHEIKQRELLYYLRAYYPKNDLAAFFAPMLNDDTDFAELIYQNYESAKNLSDLAAITHYSVSGFKKRFVKVFGIPPYNWMEQEKAKKIHYEINCTQKTFKEITSKYNFYSPSHFNKLCRRMFGMPPAKLRKATVCTVLEAKKGTCHS